MSQEDMRTYSDIRYRERQQKLRAKRILEYGLYGAVSESEEAPPNEVYNENPDKLTEIQKKWINFELVLAGNDDEENSEVEEKQPEKQKKIHFGRKEIVLEEMPGIDLWLK